MFQLHAKALKNALSPSNKESFKKNPGSRSRPPSKFYGICDLLGETRPTPGKIFMQIPPVVFASSG